MRDEETRLRRAVARGAAPQKYAKCVTRLSMDVPP